MKCHSYQQMHNPAISLATRLLPICGKYGDEGFLRDLDLADLFHLGLALLLFFEEFFLAGYVAAVTFGRHVFAIGLDRRAGDDLAADGALDRNLELMARNGLGKLFAIV